MLINFNFTIDIVMFMCYYVFRGKKLEELNMKITKSITSLALSLLVGVLVMGSIPVEAHSARKKVAYTSQPFAGGSLTISIEVKGPRWETMLRYKGKHPYKVDKMEMHANIPGVGYLTENTCYNCSKLKLHGHNSASELGTYARGYAVYKSKAAAIATAITE